MLQAEGWGSWLGGTGLCCREHNQGPEYVALCYRMWGRDSVAGPVAMGGESKAVLFWKWQVEGASRASHAGGRGVLEG